MVDVLFRSLQKRIQNGIISGIKLARHYLILSHLLFIDDYLFFLRATGDKCQKVFKLIKEYCQALRQMVNKEKSYVMFSANVH